MATREKFLVDTGDIHVPMAVLAALGIEVTISFNMGHWHLFLLLQCFYAPSTVYMSVVHKQATLQGLTSS